MMILNPTNVLRNLATLQKPTTLKRRRVTGPASLATTVSTEKVTGPQSLTTLKR